MRLGSAMRLLLLAVLAPAVALLASADAQTLLRTLDTPNPQEGAYFGNSVAVGDVNGDGKGDIAVGAPLEDVDGNTDQGRAYVFSGANGSVLFTLDTPNPPTPEGPRFGESVAVGDVNGDGKGDIAVAEAYVHVGGDDTYQGRAYVFSGADGSLLFTLAANWESGGVLVALFPPVAVGDVNGDGKGDIAEGIPSACVDSQTLQGRTYIFSGADGSLLFTLDKPDPPQAGAVFGVSVAVGDVNGDGKADVAVGAMCEDVGGNSCQGRTYIFSGADGSLLFTLDKPDPPHAGAWFGRSMAVGDVNGDGKVDIAVGATGENVGGNHDQGRAYVFSGADGSLLFTLDTTNPQEAAEFGFSIAVGDVHGDGKGDIAVGAPWENVGGNYNQGRAYVFSGASGALLFTLDTPNPQEEDRFGSSLAVGDVSGDGKANVVVGAPGENVGANAYQGRAYVFTAPVPVGGIAEYPEITKSRRSSSPVSYSALAGFAAAGAVVLVVGGWCARRRWLR
jgi:hypothetical protein